VSGGSGILAHVTSSPLPIVKLPGLANVPHALPYQGSKRALAHFILRLIPDDCNELVEPFAGSAAISIGARYLEIVKRVSIGDVNEPLMSLWSHIIDRPGSLSDDYEALWNEQLSDPRVYYEAVRVRFNATGEAHLLLYLLARCVKAAVRYGKSGAFNQSADHRRLGAKPATMRARITATSALMREARVWAGDYQEALLAAPGDSVVYMDPPYQGVTNVRDHRYMRGLERGDFERSLRSAIDNDVSFIISYDGATAGRIYGQPLSSDLGLTHLLVTAGLSSQATLGGSREMTVESVYLSPVLTRRLGGEPTLLADLQTAEISG
jgi:DNA adenine methylase